MPRRKEKSTFQSYVADEDAESVGSMDITDMKMEDIGEIPEVELQPDMLPGEISISQARNVLKFIAYSDHKQGVSGWLFCTNFKVTFVTTEGQLEQSLFRKRNKLIGEHDIALTNIDAVYQVSKSKRKRLTPSSGIVGKVKSLEIHCKDFRIHTFSFKFSDPVEAKTMAHAIVHHSFPTRLELLFAFEYRGDTSWEGDKTLRYRKVQDWEHELQRLNVKGFKATLCNPKFRLSQTLPECVVVPGSLTNAELGQAVPQFNNYRAPTWSYTHSNGASLLRMSQLMSETTQTQWENKMLDAIKIAHPQQLRPRVYDLAVVMPTFKEVQAAYERLKETCMPVSRKDFWETDKDWLSVLDNTQWLQCVGKCLKVALRVADILTQRKDSIVLKEAEGRDFSALISCLTQILLDPYCRTIHGFQCLVEREFVSLGHRFTSRCGLLQNEDQQSPLFLLFLDAVWQLTQQFPSAMEFSSTYLISIWDSICLGLFDNFIFNSERERMLSAHGSGAYMGRGPSTKNGHSILSVWDWSKQFDEDDLSLNKNPLYLTRTRLKLQLGGQHAEAVVNGVSNNTAGGVSNDTAGAPQGRKQSATPNRKALRHQLNTLYAKKLTAVYELPLGQDMTMLRPVVSSTLLRLWESCYLRWLSPVQIIGGGSPLEYLHQCILVEEIICLQHQIDSLNSKTPFSKKDRRKSDLIFSFHTPSSALPDRDRTRLLTSSFPFSPGGTPQSHVSFFGTPLALFMENSLLQDSEDTDLSDGDIADS